MLFHRKEVASHQGVANFLKGSAVNAKATATSSTGSRRTRCACPRTGSTTAAGTTTHTSDATRSTKGVTANAGLGDHSRDYDPVHYAGFYLSRSGRNLDREVLYVLDADSLYVCRDGLHGRKKAVRRYSPAGNQAGRAQ
jgi:hypothetical protein